MNDPVSEELERNAAQSLPWRPALALAIGFHVGIAIALFLGPARRPRPLMLPSVQVRIGGPPAALPGGAATAPPRTTAASSRPGPPGPLARPAAAKPAQKHAARTESSQSEKFPNVRSAAERLTALAPATDAAANRSRPGSTTGGAKSEMKEASPGGNIAVGPGENGADAADFPYGYYLSRVLATIEANWFKPPGGTGMRCRVTCRIDRTGHLLEAGLDEPSAQPAFDRAALRAVYAAAPFPPLPQGYASPTLTLHLEFGP